MASNLINYDKNISTRTKKLQEILKNNNIDSPLNDEDKNIIKDLFDKYYEDGNFKLEIDDIWIVKKPPFNTKCFKFKFKNINEPRTISIDHLTGASINVILRKAIQYQIEVFKNNNPTPIAEDIHDPYEVDHVIEFQQLVKDFTKLTYEKDQTTCHKYSNGNLELKQTKKTLNEWKIYHQERAELKWVCKSINRINNPEWNQNRR